PVVQIFAANNPDSAKNEKADSFNGLENTIYLAGGARVGISSNIWKSVGLTNGATGRITGIVFGEESVPLPAFVIVKMDSYNSPLF
ncbi:hypothetical protein DFJ73DRAFT_605731, partial [Zopfochytrium polystomum]